MPTVFSLHPYIKVNDPLLVTFCTVVAPQGVPNFILVHINMKFETVFLTSIKPYIIWPPPIFLLTPKILLYALANPNRLWFPSTSHTSTPAATFGPNPRPHIARSQALELGLGYLGPVFLTYFHLGTPQPPTFLQALSLSQTAKGLVKILQI